ncbi:cytochrome P450 2D15 [Bombina bombina]|uniref:cytochrome P450 2D15 n=1 Tax=Bombina bombina TaxID=8345 RepID=UPI00235A634B|nr:cytochrome P450 2D15 [Bombina bombina]
MKLLSEAWLGLSGSLSNVLLLCIIVTGSLLLLDFTKRRKPWPRYPPGPPSRPFLGNLAQISSNGPHVSFSQFQETYGDVFSLQIFWNNMVVINGYKAIEEALLHKPEDIADRPRYPLCEYFGYAGKSKGLLLAEYGRLWKEQRRFALSTLRNFGMGKKSLEEKVVEEAGHLCSAFESEQGGPFNPHFLVYNAVSNVICSITFGERFEYDDDKFQRLLKLFVQTLKNESGPLAMLLNEVPFLLRVPGLANKVLLPEIQTLHILQEIVTEHKRTRDPEHCRDFIDAYLQEMEKVKGDEESSFNEKNLLLTTLDLFSAGTETTSATLRWSLLFMLLYPEVQEKVHKEIDQVIGRNMRPTMGDQLKMPYTNAVIHEVQRYGDISPLAVPHRTYRDTEIQGFYIPKGMTVTVNLSSVLKDKKLWERPLQFYPEHFLNAEGKFVKPEAFVPFSAGRRACPGEQLARMELFLFFTTLLQQFTFEIPEDQPRPWEEPVFEVSLSPHPFKMCAKLRP